MVVWEAGWFPSKKKKKKESIKPDKAVKTNHWKALEQDQRQMTNWDVFNLEKLLLYQNGQESVAFSLRSSTCPPAPHLSSGDKNPSFTCGNDGLVGCCLWKPATSWKWQIWSGMGWWELAVYGLKVMESRPKFKTQVKICSFTGLRM